MEARATPEFIISQMRVLTMPEMTFFHVTCPPTAFADLDRALDELLSSLYEAKAQADLDGAGPDITRYYPVEAGARPGEPDLFRMEVGIPVKPETPPAGEALVKTLPPYRCAGLLLWGSLTHTGQAYAALAQAILEAGLQPSGECREWNYWFESVDSSSNLLGVYRQVLP
jgi:effector-binding domain-containing protein